MSLLRTRLAVLTVVILGMHLGTTAIAAMLCCHETCQMAMANDDDYHAVQPAATPGAMCHMMDEASDTSRGSASMQCACGDHDAAVNALLGPPGLAMAPTVIDIQIARLHAVEGPVAPSIDWLPTSAPPPPRR
jgi:hypothetical protein